MVLEATMIIIDNSEWARNGDFLPTRVGSQVDAANLICQAKTQQNAESTVGVMTLGDAGPKVLATPSRDLGKVMSCLASITPGGDPHLAPAVHIAQLALKHRQNKNQRQRIVLFVASPVDGASLPRLARLGKALRKNNVSLDVVSFGEVEGNSEHLRQLVDAAGQGGDGGERSNFLEITEAGRMLSDVLISSPVVMGEGDGGGGAALGGLGGDAGGGGGGGGGFEFGVDPSLDPELAMALRISAEEARAREQQQEQGESAGADAGADAGGEGQAQPAAESGGAMDTSDSAAQPPAAGAFAASAAMGFDQDEDAALQAALALSVQETQAPAAPAAGSSAPSAAAASPGGGGNMDLTDPKLIESLLAGLSGVNPGQDTVQHVMRGLSGKKKDGEGEEGKKNEEGGEEKKNKDEEKKKEGGGDKMDTDGDDDHLYD